MDRKSFLKIAAGTTAGWSALMAACAREEERSAIETEGGLRSLSAIGLQLYTIRQIAVRNMREALSLAAETGYTELEFAGYHGSTPEEVRALVDELGLNPVSSHVPLEALRDDLDAIVGAAQTVGHQYVVLPYIGEEDRGDVSVWRALADEMNAYGERFNAAGIRFGYHNHDFEFERVGGARPMDVLLENTQSDLVTFELDLYWAVAGGVNPTDYLLGFPGRFELCHVKDMSISRQMVDVGDGEIPFGQIFKSAEVGGLQHFFVEHDAPADPATSIRRSYAHLSGLRF